MMRFSVTSVNTRMTQSTLQVWEKDLSGAMKRSLRKEAAVLVADIRKGIRSQAPGGTKFKPLAESTKKAKGSSKALIDKGDLVRSVNNTAVEGSSGWAIFVGVHKKVPGKKGQPMWNIAEIHEFGSEKIPNHPPARPFLRPSYKQWAKAARMRYFNNVTQELRMGKFQHMLASGAITMKGSLT